ncbi:MAG: hypothetical protein JO327_12115 [Nitrososphaeraceae archaeon]|nr:hypothetical protein [Nitrososphaeraceae archaeon]MBV9668859.1 hypothetical protein [Nitrososphaeraceae archaeon]
MTLKLFTILAFGIGLSFTSILKFALADSTNPLVASIGSKLYGLTAGEWTAKWWQWALSIPKSNSPFSDKTGQNCGLNQNGPVWFLAGTTGGSQERTCTIPAGKAILFPIVNNECSTAEYPADKTESALRSCATGFIDHTTTLQTSVDGINLNNLKQYRIQSPLFNFIFPKDNIYGVAPGPTQAVSDGYWILLQPLSPGKHNIHFNGAVVDFTTTSTINFAEDTMYHLTIT